MADKQLDIAIGADIRQLEQGLDRAKSEITDFDKSLKISGTGLVDFENKAKQGGKAAGDFGNKLKEVPAASSKATFALTNLGRVASDAPFGFIAIQNNIDPLIQSFAAVRKESGSVGGALKALGSSLAGPGGLLLGFTLISSAITVAIQKYGSLGNAIDAIFGKTDALNKEVLDAAKSYEKFNEQLKTTESIQGQAAASTQGEASRVKALASIVTNQTKSYDERNNALKELQKINKTYFGDIDMEGDKLSTLTTRVEDYTRANVQAAISKAFESEIAATSVELAKQERLLGKLIGRLGETATAQNKVSQTLPGIAQAAEQSRVGTAAISATEAYIEQNKRVIELRARIKELTDLLNVSVDSYNKLTAPINATAEAFRKETGEKKKSIAETNRAIKAIEDETKARQKRLAELLERGSKVQTITYTPIFELDENQFREKVKSLFVQPDPYKIAVEPSLGKLDRNVQIIPPEAIQNAISQVDKVKESVDNFSAVFANTLAPAIDAAFGALANGTSVIDAVKNSLKGLLAQLAANAAKALLLKVALNFIPGAGIVGAGGGGGFGSILSGLLGGGGGFGRLAGATAPSFGGVSSFTGGMQLSGQVVFRQRGADLVGVLNTQNGRINRVG